MLETVDPPRAGCSQGELGWGGRGGGRGVRVRGASPRKMLRRPRRANQRPRLAAPRPDSARLGSLAPPPRLSCASTAATVQRASVGAAPTDGDAAACPPRRARRAGPDAGHGRVAGPRRRYGIALGAPVAGAAEVRHPPRLAGEVPPGGPRTPPAPSHAHPGARQPDE